jgi:hypothetical protein
VNLSFGIPLLPVLKKISGVAIGENAKLGTFAVGSSL